MNSNSLQDRKIMVTRPQGQGDRLKQKIEELAGEAIMFPVIDIKPLQLKQKQKDLFLSLTADDVVIFVSRNAVLFIEDAVDEAIECLKKATVLAMGQGTSQDLKTRGVPDVDYPRDAVGTEGLLNNPVLQEENIKGKRTLMIRGVGGRKLLQKTLKERGADLYIMEIYDRLIPKYEPALIKSIWQNNRPDAIVITSVEGLENLIFISTIKNKPLLCDIPLVVISTRLKSLAVNYGFRRMSQVADDASDESLLAAIVRVFED